MMPDRPLGWVMAADDKVTAEVHRDVNGDFSSVTLRFGDDVTVNMPVRLAHELRHAIYAAGACDENRATNGHVRVVPFDRNDAAGVVRGWPL